MIGSLHGQARTALRLPGRGDITRLGRALVIIYFIEAGLILLIAPWTRFWDRNYFVEASPVLEPLLTSPYSRGALSGLGLVALVAAVAELTGIIRAFVVRRAARPVRQEPPVTRPITSPDLSEEAYPPS